MGGREEQHGGGSLRAVFSPPPLVLWGPDELSAHSLSIRTREGYGRGFGKSNYLRQPKHRVHGWEIKNLSSLSYGRGLEINSPQGLFFLPPTRPSSRPAPFRRLLFLRLGSLNSVARAL